MPDEFPETRMPAIDAGPDSDPFEPPELSDELIDELLAAARTPEEITGPDGLLTRLTNRLVERAMDAELTGHLGYERGQPPQQPQPDLLRRTSARRYRFGPPPSHATKSTAAVDAPARSI